MDDLFQAELCDKRELSEHNDKYNYILNVIDVFSNYAWVQVIRQKTGKDVSQALKTIFGKSGRIPVYLQTDKGKELINYTVQRMLSSYNIQFITVNNPDVKASVIERFNRTLETRMWRYFTYKKTRRYLDVLQDLVYACNHSGHSTIKMEPVKVTPRNIPRVWKNTYKFGIVDNKPKFKINDNIRISTSKMIFEKGYEPNWS